MNAMTMCTDVKEKLGIIIQITNFWLAEIGVKLLLSQSIRVKSCILRKVTAPEDS